jgi:glucose dehydrogenase
MLVVVGGASGAAPASGDWTGFGRTTDNMRHSPLVEITKANVAQLGKAYSIDFKALDADTRRGEQSYPLAVGGTLYVTTNDAQVFALEGATGKVLWHYKPANGGIFKNFGIVANRGLAYCDGALFLLTLDMHLNKLNPANGALLGRVAIGASVPGAHGPIPCGRSRRRSRAGAPRAASSAAAPCGRRSLSTPPRTRCTSAPGRPLRCTSRRSAPARTRGRTR